MKTVQVFASPETFLPPIFETWLGNGYARDDLASAIVISSQHERIDVLEGDVLLHHGNSVVRIPKQYVLATVADTRHGHLHAVR